MPSYGLHSALSACLVALSLDSMAPFMSRLKRASHVAAEAREVLSAKRDVAVRFGHGSGEAPHLAGRKYADPPRFSFTVRLHFSGRMPVVLLAGA